MIEWRKADECKPKQGDRVLLKVMHEDCPVVGYWGSDGFEVCTMNVEVICGQWCQGGSVERNFKSAEVTWWADILNVPEDDRKYLAKFRQGSGVMAMNAIDYYEENGLIIKHCWSNGGEDRTAVPSVPESIKGYERIL